MHPQPFDVMTVSCCERHALLPGLTCVAKNFPCRQELQRQQRPKPPVPTVVPCTWALQGRSTACGPWRCMLCWQRSLWPLRPYSGCYHCWPCCTLPSRDSTSSRVITYISLYVFWETGRQGSRLSGQQSGRCSRRGLHHALLCYTQ